MSEIYPSGDHQITPNLGLGLWGTDEVTSDNFILIDTAFGSGGTSVEVNGSVVNSPNFNGTTPAAPAGYSNVIWQVSGSNVSAYVTAASWASLSGDLTETQVIPWDGAVVGTPDTGIYRIAGGTLAIGNGSFGDQSGTLKLAVLVTGADAVINAMTVGLGGGSNVSNVVVGAEAFPNNTTGLGNVALGYKALHANVSGGQNLAMGTLALLSNTNSYNTAVGGGALSLNTTGTGNVALGLQAGNTGNSVNANISGSYNVWIGYQAGPANSTQFSNSIAIGNGAATTASNQIVLGNASSIDFLLPSGLTIDWNSDSGISRLGAASLAIGNGTAGDYSGALKLTTLTLQGKIGTYNGVATVNQGVAPILAAPARLTSQTAAQSAVSIVASALAGMYRISYCAAITTASDISSVLGGITGFAVTFTDPQDSVAKTSNPTTPTISAANTTGTTVSGDLYCYAKAGTAITYNFGYTDSHTSTAMAYNIAAYAEYLG